jgi:TatD DNase family protein
MYIDTHCHLNFNDYKEDALEIAKKTLLADTEMIVVGSMLRTSARAVDFAEKFSKGVYSAIGLHPCHLINQVVENEKDEDDKYKFIAQAEVYKEEDYQKLIDSSNKVVAIGEIGLEYFRLPGDKKELDRIKELQRQVFKQQLNLAKKNNLPIIIHCRDAHDDLYSILYDFIEGKIPLEDWGVIHCFSGDYELAKKYNSLGLKISFTGLITFANQWDEVIKKIPLEKIMVETDSPYLSPIPYRGKRNEPLNVKEVVKKIAELKGLRVEEVAKTTYNNAKKLFKI